MNSHSQWWRWLMVLVLPLLLVWEKEQLALSKIQSEFTSRIAKINSLEFPSQGNNNSQVSETIPINTISQTDQSSQSGDTKRRENDLLFRSFWKDRLNRLPTVVTLQKKTEEELHHTPKEVWEGAGLIGEVIEKVDGHPQWRLQSLEFFRTCARDRLILTALRSVCLSMVWEIEASFPEAKTAQGDKDYPQELIALAKDFPRKKRE